MSALDEAADEAAYVEAFARLLLVEHDRAPEGGTVQVVLPPSDDDPTRRGRRLFRTHTLRYDRRRLAYSVATFAMPYPGPPDRGEELRGNALGALGWQSTDDKGE